MSSELQDTIIAVQLVVSDPKMGYGVFALEDLAVGTLLPDNFKDKPNECNIDALTYMCNDLDMNSLDYYNGCDNLKDAKSAMDAYVERQSFQNIDFHSKDVASACTISKFVPKGAQLSKRYGVAFWVEKFILGWGKHREYLLRQEHIILLKEWVFKYQELRTEWFEMYIVQMVNAVKRNH